jgi:hypothetical protein
MIRATSRNSGAHPNTVSNFCVVAIPAAWTRRFRAVPGRLSANRIFGCDREIRQVVTVDDDRGNRACIAADNVCLRDVAQAAKDHHRLHLRLWRRLRASAHHQLSGVSFAAD